MAPGALRFSQVCSACQFDNDATCKNHCARSMIKKGGSAACRLWRVSPGEPLSHTNEVGLGGVAETESGEPQGKPALPGIPPSKLGTMTNMTGF